MHLENQFEVVAISKDHKKVIILDQTRLPNYEEYLELSDEQAMWEAIKKLQVRGAPAIGVFAAYSMAVLGQFYTEKNLEEYKREFFRQADYLNTSRPTAVNLSWALNRMKGIVEAYVEEASGTDDSTNLEKTTACGTNSEEKSAKHLAQILVEEATKIEEENFEMNKKIAEYGVSVLKEGDGILTHCNAGYLACLGYGTATAPMYMAHERGMKIKVYSDETRPLLQGARLTSYELHKAGIDVTAVCDNMAALLMKQGKIQCVMVGCDRIAANGDFANKIGTSQVAVVAKHFGVPFYVLGPASTIDFNTPTGDDIHIEMRDGDEIGEMWYKEPMVLKDIPKFNPSFDVTDHELITGIITEKGIVKAPFEENLKKLYKNI